MASFAQRATEAAEDGRFGKTERHGYDSHLATRIEARCGASPKGEHTVHACPVVALATCYKLQES